MKYFNYLAVVVFILLANTLFAQEKKKGNCEDIVYMKGGSVLRGTITEYKLDSNIVMTTWSGTRMSLPAVNVKKIVQKCKDVPQPGEGPFGYSFREQGWYHASRFAFLLGENDLGVSLQHSSGIKINRFIGLGAGVGIENFSIGGDDLPTFPLFVEMRGYLLPKRITPMYAVGIGYGISRKEREEDIFNGRIETWKGGWMAQGQIGYRIGNHAFIHLGIRFQRKTHTIENVIWNNNISINRYLYKRYDIGFGLLL